MVGLRLTLEGVSSKEFYDRFGVKLDQAFGSEINKLITLGLLEWKNSPGTPIRRNDHLDISQRDLSLVLTPRGRMVGNQVFQYFVGD